MKIRQLEILCLVLVLEKVTETEALVILLISLQVKAAKLNQNEKMLSLSEGGPRD